MTNKERNKLIEDHKDYVKDLVWASYYYLNFPSDFIDDCIGAANLALVEAADSYDAAKSSSFKSYIIKRIHGSVIDFLRNISILRGAGYRKLQLILSLYKQERRYVSWYKNEGITGTPLYKIEGSVMKYMTRKQEDQIIIEYNSQYQDSFQQEKRIEIAGEKEGLTRSFDRLSNIQRYVIYRYYFQDKTFDEIAKEFHRSRSWICRIHSSAIDQLRGEMYQ